MQTDSAISTETPENQGTSDALVSMKIDLQPPPFSEVDEGPEYTNTAVTIELNNNTRTKGKLLQFCAATEIITILEPRATVPIDIGMGAIKLMRLEKPYQLMIENHGTEEKRKGINVDTASRSFEVFFKDRTEISGKTFGSRADKNGIHFYEQTKVGRKWRYCTHLFVSNVAIESHIIGGQIGDLLVQEKQISKESLETALKDQQNERSRLIGDYLVNQKIVDADELENALSRQKNMPNLKLGEILLSENLVTEAQLQEALKEQKKKRKSALGEILVSRGVIDKDEIQQSLAKKLGIPFVNLREFIVDPEVIRVLTAAIAFKHKVVPLYVYEGKIVVAIENPMDWQVTDALSFNINKYVEPVMASPEDINWALQFYYSSEDIESTIADYDEEDMDAEEDDSYDSSIFSAAETSQVTDNVIVRIVNKIIEDAYRQKVSDIHIEPGQGKQKLIVRFRKDGVLSTYYKFPAKYRAVFVSRIKVMSHLDISNKYKPQDGKINFRHFSPIDIELRVATIPTAGGIEDVVIRILSGGKCMPVNAIGLSSKNLDKLLDGISRPHGLFLVCGPTGSGKSTTLHSVLNYLNATERKIWTAEDPVEITQPGLRQVEVNEKVGMTFSGAMRAFLRADPDIIMIGEMRDKETASTAIEASLTGHLVLSTLHTNSAAESVIRLLDMGMDPFNFADSMIGVLSQRLTKTLCTSCKKPYKPEQRELEFLAVEYCRELIPDGSRSDPRDEDVMKQLEDWEKDFTQKGEFTLYKAPGCLDCLDAGYRGRMGVHELLMSSSDIKKMILRRAPASEIHMAAIEDGMRTRKQDGIEKILLGYTDYTQIRTM
ncbi:MAG: pilus assembly protein PilB [SAR86 cluster bacterium]|uniref:Pilus assembly protein PilB n=1 Tax=SAR86 cluster bacterium TaxID=2030880 RepID=A0A2A5B5L8_9GAMM|nr:MAG: pilus assembly protein PilB [SAR86 cluster bacterium]